MAVFFIQAKSYRHVWISLMLSFHMLWKFILHFSSMKRDTSSTFFLCLDISWHWQYVSVKEAGRFLVCLFRHQLTVCSMSWSDSHVHSLKHVSEKVLHHSLCTNVILMSKVDFKRANKHALNVTCTKEVTFIFILK